MENWLSNFSLEELKAFNKRFLGGGEMTYSQYIEKIDSCTDAEEALGWYFIAEEDKEITDDEFTSIQNHIEITFKKEVIVK